MFLTWENDPKIMTRNTFVTEKWSIVWPLWPITIFTRQTQLRVSVLGVVLQFFLTLFIHSLKKAAHRPVHKTKILEFKNFRFGFNSSQPTLGSPLNLGDPWRPLATIGDHWHAWKGPIWGKLSANIIFPPAKIIFAPPKIIFLLAKIIFAPPKTISPLAKIIFPPLPAGAGRVCSEFFSSNEKKH